MATMLRETWARAALLGVLLCGVAVAPARATDCRSTIGGVPALAAIDAETRLAFLQGRLDAAARAARIWTGSWAGIYTALAIGSFALVPVVHKHERVDYYFSGATSVIGLASLGLSPLRAMRDAPWLRRRVHLDLCSQLADAERLLVRDAASEAECKKLYVHLGNIALNMGSLLVLGFVFRRWEAAALQGVAGTLIGELMIATTPSQASDALEAYRAGTLKSGRPPPRISLVAAPLALPQGAGVAFGGRF